MSFPVTKPIIIRLPPQWYFYVFYWKTTYCLAKSRRTLVNEVHASTWQKKESCSFGRHTNNCLPGESSSRRCSGHNWLPLC